MAQHPAPPSSSEAGHSLSRRCQSPTDRVRRHPIRRARRRAVGGCRRSLSPRHRRARGHTSARTPPARWRRRREPAGRGVRDGSPEPHRGGLVQRRSCLRQDADHRPDRYPQWSRRRSRSRSGGGSNLADLPGAPRFAEAPILGGCGKSVGAQSAVREAKRGRIASPTSEPWGSGFRRCERRFPGWGSGFCRRSPSLSAAFPLCSTGRERTQRDPAGRRSSSRGICPRRRPSNQGVREPPGSLRDLADLGRPRQTSALGRFASKNPWGIEDLPSAADLASGTSPVIVIQRFLLESERASDAHREEAQARKGLQGRGLPGPALVRTGLQQGIL
jgi:hypothetical protein